MCDGGGSEDNFICMLLEDPLSAVLSVSFSHKVCYRIYFSFHFQAWRADSSKKSASACLCMSAALFAKINETTILVQFSVPTELHVDICSAEGCCGG